MEVHGSLGDIIESPIESRAGQESFGINLQNSCMLCPLIKPRV